jgi:hypothetical protein
LSWYPSGLAQPINQLCAAIDKRFARVQPVQPVQQFFRAELTDLPPAASWEGTTVYVRDIGAGVAMVVFSDRTNWRRLDTNAVVA